MKTKEGDLVFFETTCSGAVPELRFWQRSSCVRTGYFAMVP
jgi:hypothetical protein